MKILVIHTGGTIGSTLENGVISTNSAADRTLMSMYKMKYYGDVEFDELTPFTMLSENLSAKELNLIIGCVKDNLNSVYDGVIITHGTDTLQYTSSALGLALGEIDIPLVLVSSNYPLDDSKSNGADNFAAAVKFIISKSGNGVFVSYKNENENAKIHRSTRVLPQRLFSDYIDSVGSKPYAVVGDSVELLEKSGREISNINFDFSFTDYPHILEINSHPGDDYGYDLSRYKCVIITAYHSGTLNTSNEKFVSFCNRAKSFDIPVFLVNCIEKSVYESATVFDSLGIITLSKCSPITAYVKAWIAISANLRLKDFMQSEINNEF